MLRRAASCLVDRARELALLRLAHYRSLGGREARLHAYMNVCVCVRARARVRVCACVCVRVCVCACF